RQPVSYQRDIDGMLDQPARHRSMMPYRSGPVPEALYNLDGKAGMQQFVQSRVINAAKEFLKVFLDLRNRAARPQQKQIRRSHLIQLGAAQLEKRLTIEFLNHALK